MKNTIINVFKTLFFFDFGLILITLVPTLFKFKNATLSSVFDLAIPFLIIVLLTFIFTKMVEKKGVSVLESKIKFKSLLLSIALGILVPVFILAVMWIFKDFAFSGFNKISNMPIHLLKLALTSALSELLYRGYLFKLYKKHYGFIASCVITTLLFLSYNLEVLNSGKIHALNVILISIVFCFVMDYFNNIILSVLTHFSFLATTSLLIKTDNLFENSIITSVVLFAIIFILLFKKYKSFFMTVLSFILHIKRILSDKVSIFISRFK